MGADRVYIGPLLAMVVAVLAGLGIAFMDTRPGYDDTGVTAAALAIAAMVAALLDGSGRVLRVAALAVLVGIWIPLFEIAAPGTYGPLLAIVFSGIGAFVGWVIVRGLARAPTPQ